VTTDQVSSVPAEAQDPATVAAMTQLLGGFQISQAIYVIAKLDVATVLAEGPSPVAALAGRVGADPDRLRRLIRSLAPLGLFHRTEDDIVELAPLGWTLSATHPESARHLALYWMETHYRPFTELLNTVRDGEIAAERYLRLPFFDWISGDPYLTSLQNQAMASSNRGAMFDGYRLPAGSVVADIGGADGTVLTHLLASDPGRRGIVFDLPGIVSGAAEVLDRAGLAGRVEVAPGDFFTAVPAADVYVLSAVLHDWDDPSCRRILRSIATAAAPGARLVLVEMIIPPGDEPHHAKLVDLVMMTMLGGRERTAAEYTALLAGAGFAVDQVVATSSPFSFVEATLVQSEEP
jgi:hypothetical protein